MSKGDEFKPGDHVTRLVFGPNGAARTWRRGVVVKKLRTRYRVDWGIFGVHDHAPDEIRREWRDLS